MSPSSIFSFDTLRLGNVPRAWTWSVLAAIALVGAAEAGARWLMAPLGNRVWTYWDEDAADEFEWYRERALAGNAPEVVAVGDSTGGYNFDPQPFREEAGGVDAYNLAWPANFPRAFELTTLPILAEGQAPRTVLLMQAATTFLDTDTAVRNETQILNSVFGRRARGEFVFADWCYLARANLARRLLISHWLYHRDEIVREPKRLGFHPLARGSIAPPEQERQMAKVKEEADRVALDQRFLERGFDEERRAVVPALARLAKERGFRLIVVLTPTRVRPLPQVFVAHRHWLQELATRYGFEVWDYLEDEGYGFFEFSDGIHLRESAARKFSVKLGERYAREMK